MFKIDWSIFVLLKLLVSTSKSYICYLNFIVLKIINLTLIQLDFTLSILKLSI